MYSYYSCLLPLCGTLAQKEILVRGRASCSAHQLRICGVMLSGPFAFLVSSYNNYRFTSFVVMLNLSNDIVVREGIFGGSRVGSVTVILGEK